MSVKYVAKVLDGHQGLKSGSSWVMLALAYYADERHSCFPGQGKIAARTRCSKRSVVSYLKELEEIGLISIYVGLKAMELAVSDGRRTGIFYTLIKSFLS
ncbi:helix-turn-helix domain-containing protein [Corynebacterium cystitidis]|uniref:helix-turn-helix domain-containing protein n=1 Tax=Corynebacterium cystitidis TaxID=35757 RepID=UPI00211F3D3E|nr:helix-turn-helix domain-containing protein [Corynebacterium cystitidis]